MRARRVGLFSECYRPIQNGIVTSIDSLAHALRSAGDEAIVVTPAMPKFSDDDPYVVRIPSLPLPTRTAYRLTLPVLPRAVGALSIVHTHSPFVTGWLGARAARDAHVPLVFTYHTQLEAYAHYVPFDARATRNVASHLTRRYANNADAVIVPTAAMERRLRELGVRTPIEVVASGIDVARFSRGMRDAATRARFGVSAGESMVLCVGRLGREKNVELALEAFARIGDPDARLVIIGDGPHRPELERHARRLGVERRTIFAGEIAREALPDAYASADALVFGSLTETQGLVLVEALAAGVPIVAVDTPQTRDVTGDAAHIVPADAGAVAAALAEVLATPDPVRRVDASASAARYDREVLGGRVLGLYDALITERGSTSLAH